MEGRLEGQADSPLSVELGTGLNLMTPAETKTWALNRLNHPGATFIVHIYPAMNYIVLVVLIKFDCLPLHMVYQP